MDTIIFNTKGVCPKEIIISIQDGILTKVTFKSGCNGNQQAVSRLVEGMRIESVIEKLKGINCGEKGTSCPDQLSKALQEYLNNKNLSSVSENHSTNS